MVIKWVKRLGDEWAVGASHYNPHGNEARDEEYRTFDRKWRGYPSGYRVESHQDKQLSEAVERHLALEFWRIQDA